MSEASDLSTNDSMDQVNSLKRTHEEAGLGMPNDLTLPVMRQAYSDDDLDCRADGTLGRPSTPGPKPGKKTRGRVKINMEFIDNKLRRYTTFSKRKSGIMKKAHELATLTGTQVMLLVASETGHVYTFATRKLQPILSSEAGKQLIQTCLNSPDPPESTVPQNNFDQQRMSAQGFEEPDLSYAPAEESKEGLLQKTYHNMITSITGQSGMSTNDHVTTTSAQSSAQERANESPMNLISVNNSNANASRGQVATILPGAYIMSGGAQHDARQIQFTQGDSQMLRASVSNASSVLAQPALLTQQPAIIPERLNDGQITLLSSYGTLQRQVPAMQQVLWTPAAALHTQPIAVMRSSPQSEDSKADSKT